MLEHLDALVVKAVGESGGYGMLVGPHSTAQEREEFRARILADPRNLHRPADADAVARRRASSTSGSSRGTSTCGPTSSTATRVTIVPGGLTRVALRKGSLVVNSSQGGGSKDTWVLEDDPFEAAE